MITLFLGGARSGKSELAERRALALAGDGPLHYVATGIATDDDMARRIDAHRERRDPRFVTVEAGIDLGATLLDLDRAPVLVDALGTWVARHDDFVVDLDALVVALLARAARVAPTVLVSDEVGLGVHPESEVGRRFRDALGMVNQRVAEVADHVYLVVAGRALALDRVDGG
jgi:adenosylcobinamide kinase/adenosylcobinamide-phosphate guanylyltransferase